MMRLLPGACLRETAILVTGALAALVSRRSDGATGSFDSLAWLVGCCGVSGVALMIAMPSVLTTIGLGVPASAADLLLIGLGIAVAAQAWRSPGLKGVLFGMAYAGLLVFAVPLIFVRILA